ncbi:MAG: membrane protein insertase YidC [Planctomycetes bacterium]|nr:membrane protein insertase YidC [Planctomycetota bacterium]
MDKRSILALVLCLFIFVGWMWLSPKIWPPPKPVPPGRKPDPVVQAPKPADPVDPVKPAAQPVQYPEKPPIALSSKYLDVVFTNKGAGVEGATLHFPKDRELEKESDEKKNLVPVLRPFDAQVPHLAIRQVEGPDAIESLPWEVVEQKPDRVEFRYRLRNGVEITKVLALDVSGHKILMTLMLDNKNPVPAGAAEPPGVNVQLEVVAVNGLDPDSLYRYEQYLIGAWSYDKDLHMKPLAEVEKGESKLAEALKMPNGPDKTAEIKQIEDKYFKVNGGLKQWFGLKNRFFATLVQPDGAALDVLDFYQFRLGSPRVTEAMQGHHNITASARTIPILIGKDRKVMQFTLYVGPLEDKPLREAVPGAEVLAAYTGGCFLSPIIKPAAAGILEVLRFTAKMLGNMGFSIIVTTLLIRLCLFPLSLKSQRNALQMQQIAPKIQALKERYKDDQQKYGIEQMRLFKEHKVNPVAGCLPLFIQMPIFIGMYSVFEMAIDLRHAGFLGWIHDLSQPDRLFGPWKPVVIPLLITELSIEAFNLLPILMTITWFLQAYFTPRSPDPQMAQQQKMMMWMPIVFGLTCYGLASGLSLYFLANSLLSMAEQKIIKRYILKIDSSGKPLASAVPEGGK